MRRRWGNKPARPRESGDPKAENSDRANKPSIPACAGMSGVWRPPTEIREIAALLLRRVREACFLDRAQHIRHVSLYRLFDHELRHRKVGCDQRVVG